ncbi:uncharacterized protein LOC111356072 [Spodoptera litura]|uniref:Uncharacterized protein LOC111356072 n=1 Tax=Spodoptera litura TaxID=69820 RepID=A0A9J7EEJ5_SPOLT|nr:uncharacterized protein LOC111356072 [Spodoptera litura]
MTRNCIEEQILGALAKWRNGTIAPSVPLLKGIRINSVEGLYEGFGIKIRYRTGEMKLSGVENFTIEQLSVSAKNLEASGTVRFPVLMLTSDNYNLNGRAYVMYSLKGSGLMKVIFQNTKLTLGTKLVQKGTVYQVEDVNLNFSVKSVQINLEDSSWPINTVLNSNAMQILESYRSEMVAAAKDMLKQAINGHLATTIFPQLLNNAGNNFCTITLSALRLSNV